MGIGYSDTIVKPVYVVSTADKVELFVNGRSLGWGTEVIISLYIV